MTPVLVVGATGTIGRAVVTELRTAAVPVRAMTRHPETAALPDDVEIVRGDLTDASFDDALRGVDDVFLVYTAPPDALPGAIARLARHARRVVLLTTPHRTPHPFFQQTNPMAAMHAEMERLIEQSGLRWTFLRPGMFAANARAWWLPQIRLGDVVRWPYGDAPTAPIDERDIAAVAVRALREQGHDGAQYVLTGPESLTQREQVAIVGEVLGRSLRYEEVAPEESKLPPMLLEAWAAALGQPAYVTSTVEEILGRPARTFREWARHSLAL